MVRSILLPTLLTLLALALNFGLLSRQNRPLLAVENTVVVLATQDYVYAHRTIDAMTLDQKVGQLIFASIPGTTLDSSTRSELSAVKPGGVILMGSNITSQTQTTALTTALNTWYTDNHLPPVLIGIDEEGGVVERIPFDPAPYTQPELGRLYDEHTTRTAVDDISVTLKNLGISVNFAPVADIAFSPSSYMADRAFGSDPSIVAALTSWSIDEYNTNGIMSCAKHFPGHGRAAADSHTDLPTVAITQETWYEYDAKPYVATIDQDVPMVMSGHLLYSQIDSKPASLSSIWLTDILRTDMGFGGIIISDDIKMGALGGNVSKSAVQAIAAGNDMLIAVVYPETLTAIHSALTARYASAETLDELDAKVIRILKTKYAFLVAPADSERS